MKYRPLFHIVIRHSYYEDCRCPDFSILPDPGSAGTLKGHRLVVVPFMSGMSVLAPIENGLPLIEVSKDTVFKFWLLLQNKRFFYYTDIVNDDTGRVYENKGRGLELKLNADSTEKASPHVFGTVRLTNISYKENAPTFTISFSAREIKWKYVLLTDETDPDLFSIEQTGLQETRLEFNSPVKTNSGTGDALLKLLEQDYPEANKWILESKSEIPFLQRGRTNLQLKKDNQVLVDHLPNPRPEEGGIKVIKIFKK